MAMLIKADGSQQNVQPQNGRSFTLSELQSFVGGNIQIITLADKNCMVINECGKLAELPQNQAATQLYMVNRAWYDPIVGDALTCTETEAGNSDDEDAEKAGAEMTAPQKVLTTLTSTEVVLVLSAVTQQLLDFGDLRHESLAEWSEAMELDAVLLKMALDKLCHAAGTVMYPEAAALTFGSEGMMN